MQLHLQNLATLSTGYKIAPLGSFLDKKIVLAK